MWPLTRAIQDSLQLPHTHDRALSQILYNCQMNQVVSICLEPVLKVRRLLNYVFWYFIIVLTKLFERWYKKCDADGVRMDVARQQSYINQYFCDLTTQSHASEWEKSPQKLRTCKRALKEPRSMDYRIWSLKPKNLQSKFEANAKNCCIHVAIFLC